MSRNVTDLREFKESRKSRAQRGRQQRREKWMRSLRVEPLENRVLLAMVLDWQGEIAPGAIMQRSIVLGGGSGGQNGGPEGLGGNGLEFNFNAAPGTPQNVIDGFAEAGRLWSALLTDDIMVNIDISFPALGAGILGSTSIVAYSDTYANARAALIADARSADDATAVANLPAGPALDIYINRTA
ncbi:MAG: hypothetical protein FJ276_20880, partial [Planctomycetes bacterium]|nr:hypothetical protein [Planctomycetota bacterium]